LDLRKYHHPCAYQERFLGYWNRSKLRNRRHALGLSPVEAVKIACTYDTSSHEPIERRFCDYRGEVVAKQKLTDEQIIEAFERLGSPESRLPKNSRYGIPS